MKSSKAALQTSPDEECGVWLDTMQLKQKSKKKNPTRPISKLLNPLTKGEGYSLAVALNFTQTKMEMPKTKQSSISAFFTPHRRILNKMSTSEKPNLDPEEDFSSSTSPAPTAPSSRKKRRRDVCLENFDLFTAQQDVAHEWENENETQSQTTQWQTHTSHSSSQNMYCETEEETSEECKSPRSKKRLADSSLAFDSQLCPQAWSQDPLLSWSQFTESEPDLTDQEYMTTSSSEPTFLNSVLSEEPFKNLMADEGRTSTQKSFKLRHFSELDGNKENGTLLSCDSPSKHSSPRHVSNQKWIEHKPGSPQKFIDVLLTKAVKDESLHSQNKWTKQSFSPLKNPAPQTRSRDVDEESLAVLFTQDTQGFRVIAHRGLQARSPFKDQSNLITGRVKTYKSVVEEEEDDILFTQDSQGNVVIKH